MRISPEYNSNKNKIEESSEQENENIESQEEDQNLESRVRGHLAEIFDEDNDGQDRAARILSELDFILNTEYVNGAELTNKINELSKIEDRQEFIDSLYEVLRPASELIATNKDVQELRERRPFEKKFIKVNELLFYGIGEDGAYVHIHLAPARAMGMSEKLRTFKDGLQQLAKIVEQDPNIKSISAASWIVAKNSKLMEKLGFTVVGEISDEMKQAHFAEETRDVGLSYMSREDFLSKYL